MHPIQSIHPMPTTHVRCFAPSFGPFSPTPALHHRRRASFHVPNAGVVCACMHVAVSVDHALVGMPKDLIDAPTDNGPPQSASSFMSATYDRQGGGPHSIVRRRRRFQR